MRISLLPFDNAVAVVVPMPPIDTIIFCALNIKCAHFDVDPRGWVPFMVFVDAADIHPAPESSDDVRDWAMAHRIEILAEARRLALTPVFLN